MSIGDMIQLLPHSQIEVLKACSHLVLVGYTIKMHTFAIHLCGHLSVICPSLGAKRWGTPLELDELADVARRLNPLIMPLHDHASNGHEFEVPLHVALPSFCCNYCSDS